MKKSWKRKIGKLILQFQSCECDAEETRNLAQGQVVTVGRGYGNTNEIEEEEDTGVGLPKMAAAFQSILHCGMVVDFVCPEGTLIFPGFSEKYCFCL